MGRVEGYKSGGGQIKFYHYKGIGRRFSHAEEGGHNIFLGSFISFLSVNWGGGGGTTSFTISWEVGAQTAFDVRF